MYYNVLISTFQLACRNNLDERALELMEILSNPQIITLALKYATKLERKRLAEKLMNLAMAVSEENGDLGVTVRLLLFLYVFLKSIVPF